MALDIKATLRVFSKKHALSELTGVIGEPKKGFSIGDKFSKGKKVREHTYWSIDSSNIEDRDSFDNHVCEVLNYYDLKKGELLKLRNEECEVNIFCMFASDNGQGGATLSADTMERLSKFNLDLIFDVYAE